MRNLITLFVTLFSLNVLATNSAVTCALDAIKRTRIDSYGGGDLAVAVLCSGAKSNAPVDCFLEGKKKTRIGNLGGGTALLVELCTGATSNAPVACALDAEKRLEFVPLEIVQLCSTNYIDLFIKYKQ